MKGRKERNDLERKGHKERQGPDGAAAVREGASQSEGRYRDIRQITNHPGEQPDPETATAAHTVTGPSPTSHCTGLLRTAYAKQYRDIKLYDRHRMGYPLGRRRTDPPSPFYTHSISWLSERLYMTFWLFTRRPTDD